MCVKFDMRDDAPCGYATVHSETAAVMFQSAHATAASRHPAQRILGQMYQVNAHHYRLIVVKNKKKNKKKRSAVVYQLKSFEM